MRTLADRDSDSCCAREAIMVSSTSPLESMVLIFSFSKKTAMFKAFSFLEKWGSDPRSKQSQYSYSFYYFCNIIVIILFVY